jgi:CelD/BcsL family acetyltransferase involved in cellulose biosynthesis
MNVREREHASADDVCFRAVESEQGFLALRQAWDELYSQQNERLIEHSFAWKWAAWETVARPKGYKLCIIVGYFDRRLITILPLVIQQLGPFRIGHWLGSGSIEYCDVIAEQRSNFEGWVSSTWDAATSHVDLLRFPFIRLDAKIWPYVERARSRQWVTADAPYIDCRQWTEWQAYYDSRSKSFKKGFKESLARLRKSGEPQFAVIKRENEGENRFYETLDWLLSTKSEWLEQNGIADPGFVDRQDFYRRVCKMPSTGEPILIELTVRQARVAAQLGFREGDEFYGRIVAQDANWKSCGTGRLITFEAVRWAFQNRIKRFDLGAGDEAFKTRFTDHYLSVAKDIVVASKRRGSFLMLSRQFANLLTMRKPLTTSKSIS